MTMSPDAYMQFDTKMWKTIGARFNAYRRFQRKQSVSIFTISILSLYNLALALLPINKLYPSLTDLISPITALTSVFVLILSLLEFSKGYDLKAERLHNNAKQLNALYSRFRAVHARGENAEPLIAEYHSLIDDCPENHEFCDLRLFEAQHYKDFKLCWGQAIWIYISCGVRSNFFYFLLLVVPLLPLVKATV